MRDKYQKFREQYSFFTTSKNPGKFSAFKIPANLLVNFNSVCDYRGFFISTKLLVQDLNLETVPGIAIYYKNDWDTLNYFVDCIYDYAKYPFLERFCLDPKDLFPTPSGTSEDFLRIASPQMLDGRVISKRTGAADIFVFRESPEKLLPISKVFRRDELPDINPAELGAQYQRPLVKDKLCKIRQITYDKPTFIFPNSIIGVLSPESFYLPQAEDGRLEGLYLPKKYGSIVVVDGQHRLFSYAGPASSTPSQDTSKCPLIPPHIRRNAQILVMAIRFKETDQKKIIEHSAKTFIEINSNHTKVSQRHIYFIAYDVLGETDGAALAAKIILGCNLERGVAQGLFKTNQLGTGRLPVITVIEELGRLVDKNRLKKCQKKSPEARGYKAIFGKLPLKLTLASPLIETGTSVLKRYFKLLKVIFEKDWPTVNSQSSMNRAKFFAAFIRLLSTMVQEGKTWKGVERDLKKIRTNVMRLTKISRYDSALFREDLAVLPTWKDKLEEIHKVLMNNRRNPTKK